MAITENCLALETCTFLSSFYFCWFGEKKPFQGLPFKEYWYLISKCLFVQWVPQVCATKTDLVPSQSMLPDKILAALRLPAICNHSVGIVLDLSELMGKKMYISLSFNTPKRIHCTPLPCTLKNKNKKEVIYLYFTMLLAVVFVPPDPPNLAVRGEGGQWRHN